MTSSHPDDGVYASNTRTTYTRRSDLARYDAQAINATIDEAFFGHVGYLDEDAPIVVPVLHTRVEESLILHTASGSRLATLADPGTRLCVTISLLDGLVMARSQIRHDVNYRSVVIRGEGVLITDEAQKLTAMAAVVDHLASGRSRQSRPPTQEELSSVAFVRVPLTDVSLKSRSGPPNDPEDDHGLHYWAGVIGVRNSYGPAFPAPNLPYDRSVPGPLANYSRSARGHR